MRFRSLAMVGALLLAVSGCGGEPEAEGVGTTSPPVPTVDAEPSEVDEGDGGSEDGAQSDQPPRNGIVSALFGLDDALSPIGAGVCPEGFDLDGMPVVLGSQIDTDTLDTGDFEIDRSSGATGEVLCVTVRPSTDLGELRTVLLIGQYGSQEDPPTTVRIVDDLLTLDGSGNFRGSQIAVTPLPEGPSIVLASPVTADERAASIAQEGPSSCVADPSLQVLRVTWNGGITLASGDEPSASDVDMYELTIANSDGSTSTAAPIGLADLGDSDNVHELCIDSSDLPSSVSAATGSFTDPRGDLNPATEVGISRLRE